MSAMDGHKLTAVLDVTTQIDESARGATLRLLRAQRLVETLYHMQLAEEYTVQLENVLFGKIIDELREAAVALPPEDRPSFQKQIEEIKEGIYDLYAVALSLGGEEHINYVFGKIISAERGNRPLWGGALGRVNTNHDELIRRYDSGVDSVIEKLPLPEGYKCSGVADKAPEIKLLDVFSFAGALNISHKPICVFFSGGDRENLSTLSKMVVFINIYTQRFNIISREIARKHFTDFYPLNDIDNESIAKILLMWLRGHDLGHFYGVDNLADNMGELSRSYLILHEFKSDMIALYNLKHLGPELIGKETLINAYYVTLAEMLRYIRRGNIYIHPDSASAYLAYRYFLGSASITLDTKINKFGFNIEKLESDIEELAVELLTTFSEGNAGRAEDSVNRYGDLSRLSASSPPPRLEFLYDTDIPYYLELKSNLTLDVQ